MRPIRETRGREGTLEYALEMTFTVRDRGTEPTAAVALMVELLSCHPTLPDGVPLSSYRSGGKVHLWWYFLFTRFER